jgi:hypothetical protein
MIMKNNITSTIRGGIPEKDVEGHLFTTKKYLVFVEE